MRRVPVQSVGLLVALALCNVPAEAPDPVGVLTPVSGADGAFEETKWKGETVRRSLEMSKRH
jgi:hypothetical protein